LIRRRRAREPVSRIVGRREFWSLDFGLSADALDPRPDTETLVEQVLARIAVRNDRHKFLDIGTGSGCILLALLSELPNAVGVGVDIAPGAVEAAQANAKHLGLNDRASFAVGDICADLKREFDIAVSNPPYIPAAEIATLPPEVKDHDPRRALDGGPDGLAFYRRLAAELPHVLLPGALVGLEFGAGQADDVRRLFGGAAWRDAEVWKDLAGLDRVLLVRAA
jgi:release factor glutamine methyltransferase